MMLSAMMDSHFLRNHLCTVADLAIEINAVHFGSVSFAADELEIISSLTVSRSMLSLTCRASSCVRIFWKKS